MFFSQDNVETRTCTHCRQGSFSLDRANPYGCTECFCFERSNRCEQVPYIWRKVSSLSMYDFFVLIHKCLGNKHQCNQAPHHKDLKFTQLSTQLISVKEKCIDLRLRINMRKLMTVWPGFITHVLKKS